MLLTIAAAGFLLYVWVGLRYRWNPAVDIVVGVGYSLLSLMPFSIDRPSMALGLGATALFFLGSGLLIAVLRGLREPLPGVSSLPDLAIRPGLDLRVVERGEASPSLAPPTAAARLRIPGLGWPQWHQALGARLGAGREAVGRRAHRWLGRSVDLTERARLAAAWVLDRLSGVGTRARLAVGQVRDRLSDLGVRARRWRLLRGSPSGRRSANTPDKDRDQ